MPVTEIENTAALIVVDFQEGTRGYSGEGGPGAYAAAGRLAAGFRRHGRRVVLVNVAGGPPGRTEYAPQGGAFEMPVEVRSIVPELSQQASDLVVTKSAWSAFCGTELAETLRGLGITQVVICGMATSIGVESTARQAYDLGFDVVLATDAITDMNPAAHARSIEATFPMLGQLGTSEQILTMLD